MSGAAASELAKRAIVSIAFSVASWSRPTVSGSSSTCAPADSIIEFTHTTKPSYWSACTWIKPVLADPLSLVEHLVPRLGHLLDPVLAVPEELRVGRERRRVEGVLERGAIDDRVEDVLGHLRFELALPGLDPARVGELRGPDHVHAEDVDRGVLGTEPADELLALPVGVGWQELEGDRVLAVRLLRALVGRRLEGAARLVEDEERELGALRLFLAAGARRKRETRRKQGEGEHRASNHGTWVQLSSSLRGTPR